MRSGAGYDVEVEWVGSVLTELLECHDKMAAV